MSSDRTEYRRWRRRADVAAESKRHGASDTTAWARADATFSADGHWQKVCVWCGAHFTATRSDARFCKALCRQRARRANHTGNGQQP